MCQNIIGNQPKKAATISVSPSQEGKVTPTCGANCTRNDVKACKVQNRKVLRSKNGA